MSQQLRDQTVRSDFELLKMLKHHHDVSAFEEIYSRYWSKLYAAAYKRLAFAEGAENIVEEVFHRLWLGKNELDTKMVLAAHLFEATRRQVISFWHKEYAKKQQFNSAEMDLGDLNNPFHQMSTARNVNRYVQSEVDILSKKCKTFFEFTGAVHVSVAGNERSDPALEKEVSNCFVRTLKRVRSTVYSFWISCRSVFAKTQ